MREDKKNGWIKSLKDFQGYTPLHLAAENGHFDECKRLFSGAIEWNHKYQLNLAAKKDDLKVCRLCFKHGSFRAGSFY